MDSRQMYSASAHLSSKVAWNKEWIHFGTASDIKFDEVIRLLDIHLNSKEVFIITGRTNSVQIERGKISDKIRPILGKADFSIWNQEMDKVIQFNKIGVLRLGTNIIAEQSKATNAQGNK